MSDIAETRLAIIRQQHLEISELRLRLKAATEPDLQARELMTRSADQLVEQRKEMARAFVERREKVAPNLLTSPAPFFPRPGEIGAGK